MSPTTSVPEAVGVDVRAGFPFAPRAMPASGAVQLLVVVSDELDRLPLIGGDWPGREDGLKARESDGLCLTT